MLEDFLSSKECITTLSKELSFSNDCSLCKDKVSFQELIHTLHSDSFSSPTALSTEHIVSHYSPDPPSKNPHFFSWLQQNGYTHLIQQLTEENYHHFSTLRHPLIIEQLLAIKSVCESKFLEAPLKKEQCLHFATHLAEKMQFFEGNSRERKAAQIRQTKYILAEFLLLLDQDPVLCLETINQPISVSIPMIQTYFQNYLLKMNQELTDYAALHQKTQLQPYDLCSSAYLPIVLAKHLITSTGRLNFGLIDFFSSSFIKNKETPINHEASLIHTLKLLQNSPVLRYHIQSIHSPSPSNTLSSTIIRATLGIPEKKAIDEYHTRVTALSAILSHLRQEGEGSCFATSLAIEILSTHLSLCVKDLKHILEKGNLTRKIKGEKKNIPFMNRIKDLHLHTIFSFDASGSIYQAGEPIGKLWEAPGVQSACTFLGIDNPQETIENLLRTIPSDKKKRLQHKSAMDLFAALCQMHGKTEGDLATMSFIFSSQTAHPLLKTWENAIAGMAEIEEKSLIRSKNLHTLSLNLQRHLEEQTIFLLPWSSEILEMLKKKFREEVYFQYDPAIPEKNKGGFVLYTKGYRIDSEKKYQFFLKQILKETVHFFLLKEENDEDKRKIHFIYETLFSYIESDNFLTDILTAYHKSNKKIKTDLSLFYQQLEYTPWMTLLGNDSRAVLKIYFGSEKPIAVKEFTESTASEALKNIIQLCREMSEEERISALKNPYYLKPFCILGKHRLPFMPGHSSLIEAWSGNISSEEWISSRLIQPGKAIAKESLGNETKQKVLAHLQEIYPSSLSAEQMCCLQKKIKNFSSKKPFRKFRNFILESMDHFHLIDEKERTKFVRKLDSLLCSSLSLDLKKKMANSAVHFADTNWSNGMQDIHFCFVFNPGSFAIELWEVQADGSHLRALDQKEWLEEKKWQFFILPEKTLSTDQK